MNISFVTNSLGMGGSEKILMFVANGLFKMGYKVSIINLNTTKDFSNVPYSQIAVRNADILYKNAIVTNYEYVKFVVKHAKELKSDVLIGFLQLGNFCSVVAGKILHKPTIISERSDPYSENAMTKASVRMKFKIINLADGAIFQTKGASEFYSKKLRTRSAVIPNPVFVTGDLPEINYKNMPKKIISLGRIDNRQKRLDVTLQSFQLFHKTHPDYVLQIYGKGPDEAYVNLLINEYGLNDCVGLMGASNEPLRVLSKGGIFLITSDYEGISNALLEAMALGMPVVSTDHSPGGARFLITNKKNGLLTPIRDVQSIASALAAFADSSTFATECGREARKVLTIFSPDKILKDWAEYIESVYRRNCNNNL